MVLHVVTLLGFLSLHLPLSTSTPLSLLSVLVSPEDLRKETRLLLGLCLDSHARSCAATRRLKQATKDYRRALQICSEEQGETHPQVLLPELHQNRNTESEPGPQNPHRTTVHAEHGTKDTEPYIQNQDTVPYIQNQDTVPYIQNQDTETYIQNQYTEQYIQNRIQNTEPFMQS